MKLLHRVPAEILKQLRKAEARPGAQLDSSSLEDRVDSTYAHITKHVGRMEDDGLVTRKKEGRSKYIELTEHGKEVAEKVTELSEALQVEQEVPA